MDRMHVTEELAGIRLPGHLHTPESLQFAQEFLFKEGDVLILSYPKSGTTWIQEILTLIYSQGDPEIATSVPNWMRAPWLEHTYFKATIKDEEGPRFITSHLPSNILAPALQKSKAKVIYVVRNPKDVAVSYYYFHKMAKFMPNIEPFPEFLELFLEGKEDADGGGDEPPCVLDLATCANHMTIYMFSREAREEDRLQLSNYKLYYGSWFDHVKGWYSEKNNLDMFIISYEDLYKDLRRSIKKLCGFLGCPMYSEEVDKVEHHCKFAVMSQNVMVNYTLVPQEIMDHERSKFMRKDVPMASYKQQPRCCLQVAMETKRRRYKTCRAARGRGRVVGDWKNHLTDEQNENFDKVYKEKMSGCHLPMVWNVD